MQGSSNSNVNQGNKWVVNLSKVPLTPAQESLLSKGHNFSLDPTNPPNVEFISAIELACQRLSNQDAQELRAETNYLLRRDKPPRPDITKEKNKALKELREDQDGMVLIADKGKAVVVMGRKEYLDKVEGLLTQPAYKAITTDPTNKLKAKLIQKLKESKGKPTWRKLCIRPCTLLAAQLPSFIGYQKSIRLVPPQANRVQQGFCYLWGG